MDILPPRIRIVPPLLNSANPWATNFEDLKQLFECHSTGAVTTRTALLTGFPHDQLIHQYTFFNPATHSPSAHISATPAFGDENASLNTLGYSPVSLDEYLNHIQAISDGCTRSLEKYFIVSVTGTPDEVATCYRRVAKRQQNVKMPLAVEVNLSCPNIPGKPPPAYSGEALREHVAALTRAVEGAEGVWSVPFGVKTPPYTYSGQFEDFIAALRVEGDKRCPLSFITATNTLGSCLVLDTARETEGHPRLAGLGIGGMAGAPLHPLTLGNVQTLRRMLDESESTRHVGIIGVGGVEDAGGYRRMRAVGAIAVGVGTALGRKGTTVFREIEEGVGGTWEL
ncbi:dihydroorotate dehydrogenase [Xylariaceae sp. FL0016]|nr:dihydroorotate dehydrogenase [Xylariaceae sp. FL0016]